MGFSVCFAGVADTHAGIGGVGHPPRHAEGKGDGSRVGGGPAVLSPPPRIAGGARDGGAAPRLSLPPVTYYGGDGRPPAPKEEREGAPAGPGAVRVRDCVCSGAGGQDHAEAGPYRSEDEVLHRPLIFLRQPDEGSDDPPPAADG